MTTVFSGFLFFPYLRVRYFPHSRKKGRASVCVCVHSGITPVLDSNLGPTEVCAGIVGAENMRGRSLVIERLSSTKKA